MLAAKARKEGRRSGRVPADYAAYQARRTLTLTPGAWDAMLREYPGRIGRDLHYAALEAEGEALA